MGASGLLLLSSLVLPASLLLRPKADATDEENGLSVSCFNSNQTGTPLGGYGDSPEVSADSALQGERSSLQVDLDHP